MPVDLERVMEGLDEELDPDTKQLIDELSEDLKPGEDWLHYDGDRLFPPPEAPPSEAQEHVSVALPSEQHAGRSKPLREAGERQQGTAQQLRETQQGTAEPSIVVRDKRRAETIEVPRRRFVPENARQAHAVREQRLRRLALGAVLITAALGLAAALWLALQRDDPAPPAAERSDLPETGNAARHPVNAAEPSPRGTLTTPAPSQIPGHPASPVTPERAAPAPRPGAAPAPLPGSTATTTADTPPANGTPAASPPAAPPEATASALPAQRPAPGSSGFLPGSQPTF